MLPMPLPGHTENGAVGRDMAPWHRAGNALGVRPWASTLGPVSLAPSPKFVGHALHGKSAITNGCHHSTSNVVVMLESWADHRSCRNLQLRGMMGVNLWLNNTTTNTTNSSTNTDLGRHGTNKSVAMHQWFVRAMKHYWQLPWLLLHGHEH